MNKILNIKHIATVLTSVLLCGQFSSILSVDREDDRPVDHQAASENEGGNEIEHRMALLDLAYQGTENIAEVRAHLSWTNSQGMSSCLKPFDLQSTLTLVCGGRKRVVAEALFEYFLEKDGEVSQLLYQHFVAAKDIFNDKPFADLMLSFVERGLKICTADQQDFFVYSCRVGNLKLARLMLPPILNSELLSPNSALHREHRINNCIINGFNQAIAQGQWNIVRFILRAAQDRLVENHYDPNAALDEVNSPSRHKHFIENLIMNGLVEALRPNQAHIQTAFRNCIAYGDLQLAHRLGEFLTEEERAQLTVLGLEDRRSLN